MRRALVLAGGGARGAYQVGMLRGLVLEQNLDFQIVRGVSVGALNASFLAQAPTQPDSIAALRGKVVELEQLWRQEIQGNESVYRTRPGGLLALASGADSLYSLKPLEQLFARHLSLEALQNSGRDFKVGTVSLVSGRYQEWGPYDGVFLDKLRASASIPVVFPFVKLASEREVMVDGGVRNITPLSSAFDSTPDEIYVLLTSRLVREGQALPDTGALQQTYAQWDDNWLGTKVSGFDVLKRTVELLTDEIYLDDIRGALSWNEVLKSMANLSTAAGGATPSAPLIQALESLKQSTKKRYVPLYVLAPQVWYGEDNSSTEFAKQLIASAIEHGMQIASDRTKWLWPPG